ncbi:type II toxin-antitoxin system VapC family toxin [Amycolatopsis sp. Poz14]|uniref:type II toxin-antitoxin system VapC family toxin n=1 Tax=Amycolatopsis sp. Poz14 TaxID=1447705 RepID=UPI001EE8BEC2|nr:type II toxin-antitoxin system VapC family toxin [Amycolatopsis sp. Poz14]MCG3750866.1 type II toxin-antitoxin system VapC family toxin [Amycolatopsis sp. Poz14]
MVTVYYADTSAVVRVFFADEPEHAELRDLLASGRNRVLTSELTRVEFASAMAAAKRSGRIPDAREFLDQFDAMSRSSTLGVIPFRPARVFPAAQRLVVENYSLRTLDALHLAVVMRETADLTGGEPVTVVTCDARQADAAKANGLLVR